MSRYAPPGAPRNVAGVLRQLKEERFSGLVRVSGSPGGTFHLRDGLIAAVRTPGAPTTESLLLRSHRIGEDDWERALVGARAAGGVGAALTAHGLMGTAELEVVCTASVYDGAFVMALSPPGEWEVERAAELDPALPAQAFVDPRDLVEETSRRIAALTRLWMTPHRLARVRVLPAPQADPAAAGLAPRHRDLLLAADGRRTPRDLAFAVGRGVCAVMTDLARLRARGLVQEDRPDDALPSVAPRTAGPAAPAPAGAVPLPRRSPGNHAPAPPGPAVTAGAATDVLRRIRRDLVSAPPAAPGAGGAADSDVPS